MRPSLWEIVAGLIVAVGTAGSAEARTPTCRALDANDGALILERESRSSTKCTALLAASMEMRLCSKARPGTTIEYMTHYDHRGVRGKLTTLTCGDAQATKKVPKCRALEVKNKSTLAEAQQK